ncbi:hypothetical protein DICVIV_13281 [Dictyocaulus viviparus]|uniref:Uncharacterized protein n=1 Tax=Dictyocaulus viviparus TaxID=29172 RepID=A0A0D8X870_DICVI|nr:hypothetical protein DICVIV_13281 [Dictyocaulus viviparus]
MGRLMQTLEHKDPCCRQDGFEYIDRLHYEVNVPLRLYLSFMKPLLTHATPSLEQTLPPHCLPFARMFTSTKQSTAAKKEISNESSPSDTMNIVDGLLVLMCNSISALSGTVLYCTKCELPLESLTTSKKMFQDFSITPDSIPYPHTNHSMI